ncbi:MAG: HAD-IIA family hydrolase [Acidimicrobiia bacterium]|nr:HAD-IIA family hydrolase [Acidimicrobiia bacterium]
MLDVLDCLVLDCDGVVYVGTEAVPGTARLVAAARERHVHVAFMTNDTTKSRAELASAIRDTGIDAAPRDVVSAGWATALWCAEQGLSPVAHLGTPQLADALRAAGVVVHTCMRTDPDSVPDVAAVVLGGAADMAVRDLDTALAVWRPGTPVVAGNGDATYPGSSGPRVGCGSLAALFANATGVEPVIVGKPGPIMFREAEAGLRDVVPTRPRIALLGDSVPSDIVGANRAGWTSILLRLDPTPAVGSPRQGGLDVPDLVIRSPLDLL